MTALLLVAVVACGRNKGADEVERVTVDPSEVTLYVRQGEPAEQSFSASATFGNGEKGALDLVSWSITNLSVGEISPSGVLTTTDSNGGITEVVASHLGEEGEATVTVVYSEDIVEEGIDEDVVDAFASAEVDDSGALEILYPEDGVAVPRNLEGLTFFWSGASGDVARVRMKSAITDISIYTSGESWTATGEEWERAAAANSQGAVDVTVEVGNWDGSALSDVYRSDPVALTVHRLDARGSVLYWETRGEQIMRIPFGEIEAQVFWTGEDSGGTCTGCHVVSDEADLMVVSHDGVNGRFSVVDIADPDAPEVTVGPDDGSRVSFKTLSPDGRYMFSTDQGAAALYDTETGERLADYSFDEYPLQPDWAPDGERIALVLAQDVTNDFAFTDGEIVEVDFDEDTLEIGSPRVLVARDASWNHYYPAWSPDGDWLAFNRTEGSGYASDGAELFLLDYDTGDILQLDAANSSGMRNSYPRWGPLPDDDVLWLAFSSYRTYPEANATNPQVWVSAIDLGRAADGEDPSAAPFWLPGQDTESDNHLPFWWSQ